SGGPGRDVRGRRHHHRRPGGRGRRVARTAARRARPRMGAAGAQRGPFGPRRGARHGEGGARRLLHRRPDLSSPMLRLAVDLTALLTPRTGVGVLAHELTARLASRADLSVTGFAVTWRGRGALREAVPPGVEVVDRPL